MTGLTSVLGNNLGERVGMGVTALGCGGDRFLALALILMVIYI
ncbi:hypothetical protein [Microcoleus sp. Pol12A6]